MSSSSLLSPAFLRLYASLCLAAMAPNLFVVSPRFLRASGFEEQAIGWVMGASPLASLVAMNAWARLAERAAGRTPLVFGMATVAAGCLSFELAGTSLPLLIAARFLAGVGWAGVLVGSSAVTTELAPPGRLGQALGASGVLTLVAMALGPLVGELLVAHASWAWVFRTASIASLVGFVIALGLPVVKHTPPTRSDVAGTLWTWPMMRPLLAFFLAATGFGAAISFLADHTHLVGDFAVSPFFNAYMLAAVSMRLFAGGISDRLGRHVVIVPALVLQASSLAGLAFLDASWQLWPLGALFGLAHGVYYPATTALIVERATSARRLRALAAANFAFSLGISLAAFGGGFLAHGFGYPALYLAVAIACASAMTLIAIDRVKSRA